MLEKKDLQAGGLYKSQTGAGGNQDGRTQAGLWRSVSGSPSGSAAW